MTNLRLKEKQATTSYRRSHHDYFLYENNHHRKHDQLFKVLIHHFFEEFLEGFFPEVHEYIDFKSIKPLSEEMFTDLHEGESRRADIIIEAKVRGKDSLIIIHVEPQSYSQPNFHKRMYLYFNLLYSKYRKPIIPIAVFSHDKKSSEKSQFVIELPFFRVLTFNFLKLELRQMDWRKFIKTNNPAAAALLSKMGYREDEKIQVKKEFLRMMVKMELDPARAKLINGFFERYLILNEREEEELMKEIHKLDNADEIMNLPNSWEEKGLKKGIKQGFEQGIEKTKREMVEKSLQNGASVEFIMKVTDLKKEEIEEISKNLKDQ